MGGAGNDRLTGGSGADTFYFGAQSGNDFILDFSTSEDRLSFAGGIGVRTARVADYNGDGTSDLLLSLTGGGSVTLYGVSSLSDVHIGEIPAIHLGSVGAVGWAIDSADGNGRVQFNAFAGDHFAYGF